MVFSRPTILLSALLLSSASLCHGECDYRTLSKCFSEVLSDWAWTLYETGANVVVVTDEGCGHWNTVRKCVLDLNDVKHGCDEREVIWTSWAISDLLTLRRHSGSFLKPYYLLEYACGKGREEVRRHQRVCGDGGEAETIMCESLKGLLRDCEFNCIHPETVEWILQKPPTPPPSTPPTTARPPRTGAGQAVVVSSTTSGGYPAAPVTNGAMLLGACISVISSHICPAC